LKLCFISNPNSPHTQRWIDWYSDRGHQVYLIGDTPLKEPWTRCPFYDLTAHFNISKIKYIVWIFLERKILTRWQPDILHCHRVTSAGWIGSFAGFHPLVVTPWGTDLYQYPYRSWWTRWLTCHVMKKADLITTDSKDLLQQAIRFGASQEKLHLIQWGVDFTFFASGGTADRLRKKLGIGNEPVILSLRGLHPIYDQDVILEALPMILGTIPNIKIILRDFHADSTYKIRLQSLIAKFGLKNHVIWVGPLHGPAELAELYRMADIGISVSSSDGTPVSVLEALACGLPVIASDLPSLREWITHDENGLLVPVGDVPALTESVLRLLRDPGLRQKFFRVNLPLLRERADHHREMAKMEILYEEIAKKTKT